MNNFKIKDNNLTAEVRAELIFTAERQLRDLARRMATKYGRRHEADEFEADAMLYCVQAAKEWNPASGATFPTFAYSFVFKSLFRQHSKDAAVTAHVEDWDQFGERQEATATAASRMTDEQESLLRSATEPGRTYVRLVRFEGLSPAMVADQFGVPVKDVKLMLRNAYRQMCRAIEFEDDEPNLFDNH